jgi:hypothetical protein
MTRSLLNSKQISHNEYQFVADLFVKSKTNFNPVVNTAVSDIYDENHNETFRLSVFMELLYVLVT